MERIKNPIVFIFFGIIAIAIVSCDPGVQDDYIIVNNSDKYIEVNTILNFRDSVQIFEVKPQQEYLFYSVSGIGNSPLEVERVFKSIQIGILDSISNENYANSVHWSIIEEVKNNRWSYHFYHYLYITNENFQD